MRVGEVRVKSDLRRFRNPSSSGMANLGSVFRKGRRRGQRSVALWGFRRLVKMIAVLRRFLPPTVTAGFSGWALLGS